MVKREEKRTNSRNRLLEAAATCFAKSGYDGCSVADIAKEAGMSAGNLYIHFSSKEELFKTMIQQEHGGAAEKMRLAANHEPSLMVIMESLHKCIRDVGYPVDHRLWTEILAVTARNESLRETFLASDRVMRDAFVELLKKAADRGEVDKNLDFEAVSIWIYALADGLIARVADDRDFDLEKHIAVFDALILRALGAEKPAL